MKIGLEEVITIIIISLIALGVFLLTSCGSENTSTRTVQGCDTIIIEKDVPTVVEVDRETIVEKETIVTKETPIFLVGQFCGRTVLIHDETHYLVHGQLLPILTDQTILISGSCSIEFTGSLVKELK